MSDTSYISEEEVQAFMIAMKKRYDLDFTNYEPKSLNRGVIRLMSKHKIHGMIDLWGRILKDDNFFFDGIDDLLVNLTELFRNPDAWLMIRDEIYPKFSGHQELNIWHAGCSTGEEIYTNAIVLEKCGLLYKTNMLATDLSKKALSKAKKGVYSVRTLNNYMRAFSNFYPDKKLEHFFDFDDTAARIKSRYQKSVSFLNHNLVDLKMDKKFDIIFCRNVMIYFDGELKTRIFRFLDNCLNDGGYLILGYYDTMPSQSIDIFDVHSNSTRIYKKKEIKRIEKYEKDSINC